MSRLRGTPSRTMATTWALRASRLSTSHPPRSPVAPVTRTRRWRQSSGAIRPHLPRGPGPLPGLGQGLEVARRAHALPVAVVRIHLELTVLGQPLEGVALEHAPVVGREVLEELALEDEEPAVDEAVRDGRLLAELDHARAARHQLAEARGRPHAGDRADAAVPLVERQQLAEVEHELVEPVVRVDLHDVPEERAATDLDHRLGAELRLVAQPCAETTAQDDDFHALEDSTGPWPARLPTPRGRGA